MCLNIGTPENHNFSFGINGKVVVLGVPILSTLGYHCLFQQLLVYYERFDEALKLLNGYRDANTESPNALKYLYSFYSEHYPDSENTHTVLKVSPH